MAFNTPLEMRLIRRRGVCGQLNRFQYSIGDADRTTTSLEIYYGAPFNTPLEMLGVLVFGFCGFLSFCVGVCGFLVGAC